MEMSIDNISITHKNMYYIDDMKQPHVIYKYDTEKDIDNIEIGLNTIRNGRIPDGEMNLLIKQYSKNPSREDIKKYLITRWDSKDPIKIVAIKQLQEYWDSIEEVYFNHLADRMQLESFYNVKELVGYLSTRYGSGYNYNDNWFAVSVHKGTLGNTLTAMHEIMHIFFYKRWWQFCKEQGLEDKNIWDVKEAVTVLLNLWFKYQVIDIDLGYQEHTNLRKNIKKWFLETRDFKATLLKACDYIKTHKEESPAWVK